MTRYVVHTPPHRKHHQIDYTRERILIASPNYHIREQLHGSLENYDVDVFDSQDDQNWELEHSFISTIIPLYFETEQDARLLILLGKHISTGKVIPCCPVNSPHIGPVQNICAFEGIAVLSNLESLIKATQKRLASPVE